MRTIEVRDASQVSETRRFAVSLAEAHGFNDQDAGRVAIVVTELATNVLKHGNGGSLLIGAYDDTSGTGIECLALDNGVGMANIAMSVRDGHSTSGTSGNGLGAIFRGSHAVDIYSGHGRGTAILARFEVGTPKSETKAEHTSFGAISLPIKGEDVCGDTWRRKVDQSGCWFMVADGLGHGPFAADAANAAAKIFHGPARSIPSEMLALMHPALRATRGAAVGVALIDASEKQVVFAGVGNIAATLIDRDNGVRRMISNNGTVGHIARHMRDFAYPIDKMTLIVLASDGLATGWNLDAYPGLFSHHPTLIAGILWRDFSRGRDDVTVVVAKAGSV